MVETIRDLAICHLHWAVVKFTPTMHNKNTKFFILFFLWYITKRCNTVLFFQKIQNYRARYVTNNARNDTVALARPLRVFIADLELRETEREREMKKWIILRTSSSPSMSCACENRYEEVTATGWSMRDICSTKRGA